MFLVFFIGFLSRMTSSGVQIDQDSLRSSTYPFKNLIQLYTRSTAERHSLNNMRTNQSHDSGVHILVSHNNLVILSKYGNVVASSFVETSQLAYLILKGSFSRDITRCSLLNILRRFGGKRCFHLQHEAELCLLPASHWFLACLIFRTEGGGDIPPKRRLTFSRLHSVISQEIKLFITASVRTSNLI
jgi:hypothetical protein